MNATATTLRDLTRHATLDQVHQLAQSPAPFHVRLSTKTGDMVDETRGHAFGHVDLENRTLVVGAMPNCGSPFMVEEREIVHLSVVYD